MIDGTASQQTLKRLQVMILNFCRVEDGTLLTDINMRKYGMESGEVVSNAVIQELCVVHPKIERLDLTFCRSVSDVGIWSISKHCVNIEHLILYGCDQITIIGIRNLAIKLSRLITLDLSLCPLVDDKCLTVIACGGWKLQKIYLKGCDHITDNGISELAQGMGNFLTVLDASGCTKLGEFGDRGLKEIGNYCKQLQELYLTDSRRVEDNGLIAIAKGCTKLEVLTLAGCEKLTATSFKSLCRHNHNLRRLKLVGCFKLEDRDFELLYGAHFQQTLTCLELNKCARLSDKAIGAICQAVGPVLLQLDLHESPSISDFSSMIIGNYCTRLRELDLSQCRHISDESVHTLAKKVSCLTKLKLDTNPRVTTKAILSHIGKDLEFVEMATQWLGYQPKPNVEKLIAQREAFIIETVKAIKIQSMIRKKFAMKIYWDRYLHRLLNHVIPLFQAYVRGYLQRKRYRVIKFQLKRIRCIIKIQTKWRNYYAVQERIRIVKRKRLEAYRNQLARDVQRIFRGLQARKRVERIRAEQANERLLQGRTRAMQEIKSILIQRIYRGHVGRKRAIMLHKRKLRQEANQIVTERAMRYLQRIGYGMIGRIRARKRRYEIAMYQLWWESARHVQRAYRGHLGRLRFKHFKQLKWMEKQNFAATQIQRVYRGYRGFLLAQVARSLRILRIKQHFYCVEIQRFLRGCMGRHHFKIYKEIETRRRTQIKCAIIIQRVFRGHKGREAKEIEQNLVIMDAKAKPLILHLRHLEENAQKLQKIIHTMEFYDDMMRNNLFEIERELANCEKTTNKYTDSMRINGTPQRFLTQFLKVRLKDFLEHETEIHRVKYIELQKKRAELRDLEREIMLAKRELVPLTTGLIADVKRARTQRLRELVWARRRGAVTIQSLWRRALVRFALYDPYRDYWEIRLDKEQSDMPYYFNTYSKEIVWKRPLAYTYFGNKELYHVGKV